MQKMTGKRESGRGREGGTSSFGLCHKLKNIIVHREHKRILNRLNLSNYESYL